MPVAAARTAAAATINFEATRTAAAAATTINFEATRTATAAATALILAPATTAAATALNLAAATTAAATAATAAAATAAASTASSPEPVCARVLYLQPPVEAVLLLAVEHGVVRRQVGRPEAHRPVAVAAAHGGGRHALEEVWRQQGWMDGQENEQTPQTLTGMQTDKQTDRQAGRWANRQTDRQTDGQASKQANKQTNKQKI